MNYNGKCSSGIVGSNTELSFESEATDRRHRIPFLSIGGEEYSRSCLSIVPPF